MMKQDRGRLLSWAHRGMNILGWFHYLTGAVQLLLTRINEPSLDSRIVHTQTELIYRDSTRL